jgi:hypothetical protein
MVHLFLKFFQAAPICELDLHSRHKKVPTMNNEKQTNISYSNGLDKPNSSM